MPTASQCQILKTVVNKSGTFTPVQTNIAAKLETLELNEDEEDLFGLQKLKAKLNDAQERVKLATPVKDSRETPETPEGKHVLPMLPKRIRSSLYLLGFRNSEKDMKKSLVHLVEETKQQAESDVPDTDAIIQELLHSQPSMPKKKRKPPEMKPRAVCFNYPGSNLTHLQVKKAMDRILIPYPEVKMLTLEFQPRIKLLRPDKTENTCRWVITFSSEWGRNRMNGKEFVIGDVNVVLKRYDETVMLEFKQYGRMTEIMKIVKNN